MSETPNNTTVRYSDEELQEFKVLIEDKLVTARQELDFMRDQIIELNENAGDQQGADWFDDSSIHSELEMLNNQVVRQQQFVRNLENALIRIQNKTYGICIITGQLIEKKRLLLVPHATKSVSAKEEQSQQQLLSQQLIQQQMAAANRRSFDTFPGGDEESAPVGDTIDDGDEARKETKEKKQNKIITKIFKKSPKAAPGGKSKAVEEDDDWDVPDYDIEEENSDQVMGGMNLDDIADEDQMSSFM